MISCQSQAKKQSRQEVLLGKQALGTTVVANWDSWSVFVQVLALLPRALPFLWERTEFLARGFILA